MQKFGLWLAVFLATASTASANEFEGAMRTFAETQVAKWATDPVLVDAIKAQNMQTTRYDQATIDEMDTLWRAQVGMDGAPMIDQVIAGTAADFLRAQVASAGGAITEAFVMDARGLNVAASAATSDYWQGDEDKFTQTYPVSGGAIHFGDVELDGSTNTVQGQVSMTIVDPETGESVGAITVGLDISALM